MGRHHDVGSPSGADGVSGGDNNGPFFYSLDATDIAALGQGVMAFIQSAFATEAAAQAGIDSGSITTFAEVDALSWPAHGD